MSTNLLGHKASVWEYGAEVASGEIVFVGENTIHVLLDSGFILSCSISSIKVVIPEFNFTKPCGGRFDE